MQRLRFYRPYILVVASGVAIVSAVALLGGGTAGITWAGGIVGVLAGIAIGSINSRRNKAADALSEQPDR